jgi:hypothetical protein
MADMTDWEKQLGRRAQAVERAKEALDADIAAARLDGHSFREIGRWAHVNHERARTIAKANNGHTMTRHEHAESTNYSFRCFCGWSTNDMRYEQHVCPDVSPVSSEEKNA